MFQIQTGLVCCTLLAVAWPSTLISQFPIERSAAELPTFKIETEIFGDDPQSPVSRNLTLFTENYVFDFRFSQESFGEPDEVAIFDARQRHFILLDNQRRIRLKLDNLQLLRILDGMGQDLKANGKTESLVFEEFREDFQIEGNRVTVSNEFVTYRAEGNRPKTESMLKSYFEFLDHYTLLSVTDPVRMPPFARLRLNSAVKKYGFIPSQISLVVKPSGLNRIGFEATSRHKVYEELDANDQKRIDTAKQNWVVFREVELGEYRSFPIPETSKQGKKQ